MHYLKIALHARGHWAMNQVNIVAGYAVAASDSLRNAQRNATRCGEDAAREDEAIQCPALLDDVEPLRDAFSKGFQSVTELRQKRRTREGIETELSAMASEAQRGCGLSYELFVKRFSSDADDYLDMLEPSFRAMGEEIATAMGYATQQERDKMQEEIEESGGCSLTGIDPWCCPCGRHE